MGFSGAGPVDERALEVLGLEDLAELLDTPVLDEELEPGLRAQTAVAVVTEDRDDTLPDIGDFVERNPGADALRQHRVGGQSAADPEVEARAVLGVVHADEGDVVDLVNDVLLAGDGGLELARQVGVLGVADVAANDLVDRRGGIEDLVERFAGQGRTEDDARAVTARFGGLEPDGFEALPDLRDVLDFDPVELNVLTVRQVGGVPAEFLRDTGDGAQLLDVQSARRRNARAS